MGIPPGTNLAASFWEFHREVLHFYILNSLELECTAQLVLPDSLKLYPDALRPQTSDPLQQFHSAHSKCLYVPALSWLLGTDTEGQALLLEFPALTGEGYTWGGSMCPALTGRALCTAVEDGVPKDWGICPSSPRMVIEA